MVNLPITQSESQGLVTTEAPRSAVSGAGISSAFDKLAQGMDAVGQNFQRAADEQATQEGQGAVYRDIYGNLTYNRRPMTSESGTAYNRAAQMAYLAQTQDDVRESLMKMRVDSNGDATAFANSYAGFREQYLKNANSSDFGALKQTLDNEFSAQHQGMLQDQLTQDVDNNKGKITNAIERLKNETSGLAYTGGTDTPEYKEKISAIQTLQGELVKNPLFKYSQSDADLETSRLQADNMGQYVAGKTRDIFQKDGYQAALDFAHKQLWDPNLNLSAAERHQMEGEATSGIRQIVSEQKYELHDIHFDAQNLSKSMLAGEDFDDNAVFQTAHDLASHGDAVGASRLLRIRTNMRYLGDFKSMDSKQQADELQGATGARPLRERLIAAESGNNPDAQNPYSTAQGLGQFTDGTWMDMVRQHEPALAEGKTRQQILDLRKDPAISGRMVDHYISDNSTFLQNNGLDATDGNIYLAHFAGQGGAKAILSGDPTANAAEVLAPLNGMTPEEFTAKNPFIKGMSASDLASWAGRKMGAAMPGEVYSAMKKEVHQDMVTLWPSVLEGIKKNGSADPGDIALLFKQATLTGDEDFKSRLTAILPDVAKFTGLDQAHMEQNLHDMEAHGMTAMEQSVYDTKKAIFDSTVKGLKDDPIGLATSRGVVEDPGPINFDDPSKLGGSVQAREKALGQAREYYHQADMPLFRPAEAETAAAKLTSPDQGQRGNIVSTLTNLQPATLFPTLDQPAIKAAIKGNASSTDFGKYSSAMVIMDHAYRTAPQQFAQSFGPDSLKQVQDYQARVRYQTPEEAQKFFDQQKDPAYAERSKVFEDAGRKLAVKYTDSAILNGFKNWIPGTSASAPTDPQVTGALRDDFENTFAQRYAVSQDAKTAASQTMDALRQKWGKSDLNGGQLTLYPPENHYPAVNGKWDWMKDELNHDLVMAGFSNDQATTRGGASAPQKKVPWPHTLIATADTEAAINNGKPPPYIVVVTNPADGKSDFARDGSGNRLVATFDGGRARLDAELKFGVDQRAASQAYQRDRVFNTGEMSNGGYGGGL